MSKRKGKRAIKCVVEADGDGDLRVCSVRRWAERRHWKPEKAIREITAAAESMGADAIPVVTLADLVDVGTRHEPTYVLELDDVASFILTAWA